MAGSVLKQLFQMPAQSTEFSRWKQEAVCSKCSLQDLFIKIQEILAASMGLRPSSVMSGCSGLLVSPPNSCAEIPNVRVSGEALGGD